MITSTGAPHAIFRREHGELFMSRRKNRPMFFIDIAVPRDVDPEMNKVDGIFVYDIDDLQQAVSSHVADRKKEAERAADIIEERSRTLSGAAANAGRRAHHRFSAGPSGDHPPGGNRPGARTPRRAYRPSRNSRLTRLTHGIVNKIMHTPISTLKTAARESEATTVVDIVRRLFNLQEKDKKAAGGGSGRTRLMARLRIGSRGSQLALWQAHHISGLAP